MGFIKRERRGGDCRLAILLMLVAIVCCAARAQAKFEIIALPDMENYVDPVSNAHIMTAQTQWIVDQRVTENIVFVSQLGDLLDYEVNHDVEIPLANAAFDILDGEVPYSVSAGNHDFSQQFEDNFGEARYTGYDWYGGSHDTYNHYQTFSAEGYEFLHINLQKDPDAATLVWAQGVVDANLGKPTIISTHDYLTNDSNVVNRTGAGVVKDNPQVFMTLSAHIHNNPASAHLLSDNTAREPVLQILADFEDYRSDTGETDSGYLSRVIFDPDANTTLEQTNFHHVVG